MIKVLAIGNSFSQDATTLLSLLNKDIYVRNCYYGGCSLEQHYNFYVNGEKNYSYQELGGASQPEMVDLVWALKQQKWDIITIQQVSGKSGRYDTFNPYLDELLKVIRQYSDAEILWHQTWAYERNSTHPDFPFYENNTDIMAQKIQEATDLVVKNYGFRVIPCGPFIEALRAKPFFDIRKNGLSLHADGFHMSINYGKFATALVWDYILTGTFPEQLEALDSPGFSVIRETAKEFFKK